MANRKMPSLFQAIWTHGSKGNLSCPTRVIRFTPLALRSFGGDRLSIKMLFSISNLSFGQHNTTQHGNTATATEPQSNLSMLATGCLRCTILATDPERTRESRHYVRRLSCRRVKFPLPVSTLRSAAWNWPAIDIDPRLSITGAKRASCMSHYW